MCVEGGGGVISCDPLLFIMDHHVLNVSDFMDLKMVRHFDSDIGVHVNI